MACSLEGRIIKTRSPDFLTKRWKWFGPEVTVLVRKSRSLRVYSELIGVIVKGLFVRECAEGSRCLRKTLSVCVCVCVGKCTCFW